MYSLENGIDKTGSCLAIALANLMFRNGLDPMTYAIFEKGRKLDPKNVSKFAEPLAVTGEGPQRTWPPTNNAIIKFRRKVEGGRYIDHWCLVADQRMKSIIDSVDGKIKSAKVYGDPREWVSYEVLQSFLDQETEPVEPVVIKLEPVVAPPPKPKSDRIYTMLEGDNIFDLARRFKTPVNELLEHNDISMNEAGSLPVGTELHLIKAPEKPKEKPEIRYEILSQPRPMHVSKNGGCRKWSFGNVTEWKDVKSTGYYGYGTNVDVLAIAHVPVAGEIAAYYMDARSLGDYMVTGRVAFTTGFNWRDLSDGFTKPARVTPKIAEKRIQPKTVINYVGPNIYKSTYTPLDQPVVYIAKETIMVQELDGRRPDRALYSNQAVKIAGTFNKGGILYGRPAGSIQNGYWFGIPMANLIAEEELYSTDIPLIDRAAMPKDHRTLSLEERGVVALAKAMSHYTRFINLFNRKTKE